VQSALDLKEQRPFGQLPHRYLGRLALRPDDADDIGADVSRPYARVLTFASTWLALCLNCSKATVAPTRKFRATAGLLGVHPLSGLGDDCGNLHAVLRDQVLSGPHEPV
jgi:hypothetical protein